jgi:16S rRNA G1207 methylase RsmC
MLAASGYTPPPKPKTKSALPLLNISGEVSYRDRHRGGNVTCTAHPMTKEAYKAIGADYTSTFVSACGTHRLRSALVRENGKSALVVVFLTDSKEHDRPNSETIAAQAQAEGIENAKRGQEAYSRSVAQAKAREAHREEREERDAISARIDALRGAATAGVQVVAVPQLFPTPREIAARMAGMFGPFIPGPILEPSAGTGNLVRAVAQHNTGFDNVGQVVAVEINPSAVAALKEMREKTLYATPENFSIRKADFLSCGGELGTFRSVIMNPPFDHGSDISHVKHALTMLRPGGRLVALCANGPRQNEQLRPLCSSWEVLPPGSFANEGTGVSVALLMIDKDA